VDLHVSASNCGACGVSCAGTCVAGSCNAALEKLVTTANGAKDIHVDESSVYFIETGTNSIVKVSKWGGPSTVLAAGQAKPAHIAIDDAYVYWTNTLGASVMRVPKAGGAPALVAAASQPSFIEVEGDEVFWFNTTDRSIMKAPKDGSGPAIQLATQSVYKEVANMKADATYLYWVDAYNDGSGDQYIHRVPRDLSGPAEKWVGGEGPMAMDDGWFYYDDIPSQSAEIGAVSKTGTEKKSLFMKNGKLGWLDIEVDDAYVYADGIGRVLKCGNSIPSSAGTGPDFATDGAYLYGTDGTHIYRAPR
jgi:hypothetical protein